MFKVFPYNAESSDEDLFCVCTYHFAQSKKHTNAKINTRTHRYMHWCLKLLECRRDTS